MGDIKNFVRNDNRECKEKERENGGEDQEGKVEWEREN